MFTRAGSYRLALAVADPVSGAAVQIPSHSALDRLVILPGAAIAERTRISDLPEHLTAGRLPCATHVPLLDTLATSLSTSSLATCVASDMQFAHV